MAKVQYKRLEKLAEHLEKGKLSVHRFDFDYISKQVDEVKCKTVGCAIGECPTIFKGWTLEKCSYAPQFSDAIYMNSNGHAYENFKAAAEFFGLTEPESESLFSPEAKRPWARGSWLKPSASAKTVARSIRGFIAWKKEGNELNDAHFA